jgi:hypothetical protein
MWVLHTNPSCLAWTEDDLKYAGWDTWKGWISKLIIYKTISIRVIISYDIYNLSVDVLLT